MMVITFYMTDYNAFALTGRDCSNTGDPQGAATLALGYGLHWAFSPPLQKHFYHIAISNEALYCSFGIASPLRIDK